MAVHFLVTNKLKSQLLLYTWYAVKNIVKITTTTKSFSLEKVIIRDAKQSIVSNSKILLGKYWEDLDMGEVPLFNPSSLLLEECLCQFFLPGFIFKFLILYFPWPHWHDFGRAGLPLRLYTQHYRVCFLVMKIWWRESCFKSVVVW